MTTTNFCCCCIASNCNLTPFQHSNRARPSFSDHEIKDDDDSTHQISPILTHITDYTGGDVYNKLTCEQFSALFSADLDASDDDFGGFEPASNAVMTDITSRDVACSRRTTLLTMKSVTCDSTHVPVAVVVNSLTLTHCQGLDLGYRFAFVTDFCYRLICASLILLDFLP